MNLKFKYGDLDLEIQNGDNAKVENVILGLFAHIKGESFIDAYNENETEEKSNKCGFVEAVKGVKILKGIEHYQCFYKCACGRTGVRFVKEDAEDTTCHGCGRLLKVEPATANDLHDEEYNYFAAY